ncbi:MAG: hypothetical protein OXU20_16190 [Myxococcales bacterium]|nr:hypothetical protein [Myxococcales bacterium]MDD9971236.1 hypothetical protein [Myxococcales bacterium]
MLPPVIIEHIKRRELEERRRDRQPRLELPLPMPARPVHHPDEEDGERGVVIIDVL